MSWTIDASGAVTTANLVETTIHNANVEECILREVEAWHFPSSDGVSEVRFPFVFGIAPVRRDGQQ